MEQNEGSDMVLNKEPTSSKTTEETSSQKLIRRKIGIGLSILYPADNGPLSNGLKAAVKRCVESIKRASENSNRSAGGS
jgi:hypothetical protein